MTCDAGGLSSSILFFFFFFFLLLDPNQRGLTVWYYFHSGFFPAPTVVRDCQDQPLALRKNAHGAGTQAGAAKKVQMDCCLRQEGGGKSLMARAAYFQGRASGTFL